MWINFCHLPASDKTAEKLLVYWLERHVMETRNASITLVLNYQDAGSQNMVGVADFCQDQSVFLSGLRLHEVPPSVLQILLSQLPS